MSWKLALLLVAVAGVAVVAFFFLARRQAPADPLLTGVNGLVGAVTGWGNKIVGAVTGVVSVPVRVANDAVSVVEDVVTAPVNLIRGLF